MQLRVRPYHINTFPLAGLLIKGDRLCYWLEQLQHLQIDLEQTPVYAIPGTTANTVWGCFVPLQEAQWRQRTLNANEPCQYVHHNLYIPQYATIYPLLNAAETARLFPDTPHLLHPELGLVNLDTPIEWPALLTLPEADGSSLIAPVVPPRLPSEIRRAEIRPLPPEETLRSMEENIFPAKQNFSDKPLNFLEKIKLGILKGLFSPAEGRSGSNGSYKSFVRNLMDKIIGKLNLQNSTLAKKLQEDLEDLERRNQTELEKLMQLFRNNPEEALKYAIPLSDGTGRGDADKSRWEMGRFMNNFDLFGRSPSAGSGTANFGNDSFLRLQQQYMETARSLIAQKEYEKAAFVYMKLLKHKQLAAQTLEEGKMYAEAASVYLKYLQNKSKAAECYEKGQMITDAIGLYQELKEYEKVGDLYMIRQNKEAAYRNYQIVADEYIAGGKYVKASLLYRHKMDSAESAQDLLLSGWRKDHDAFNCLNNYFQNIPDKEKLLQAIEQVYKNDTDGTNKQVFLKALQYEQKKDEAIADRAKEMAYEIIADLAKDQPGIIAELKHFNDDPSLPKDLGRYKTQR